MASFAAGSIVLVRFPFSDLSQTRLRPAVVLAPAGRGDFILCQLTSNPYADTKAIEVTDSHLSDGSLHRTSYARPGKLFTTNESVIGTQVATLDSQTHSRVIEAVVELLRSASGDVAV